MMNNRDDDTRTARPDDDAIDGLIRSAGPRPEIPGDDLAAIRDAAGEAWHGLVAAERRKRMRRRFYYAAAATLLVAVVGSWWWLPGGGPGVVTAATVELAQGSVEILADGGETGAVPAIGEDVSAGSHVRTGDDGAEQSTRVALRMANGQSVRLDAKTRIALVSESRIDLEQGALYVDSGPSVPDDANLEIHTPLGVVREIGTQYEIRLRDGAADAGEVTLRVREGSVSIRPDGEAIVAASGEELTVGRDGSVARSSVLPDARLWSWIQEAAPPLEIEGLSLSAYLGWVARETGLRIIYDDADLARAANEVTLHGSIEGLRPGESVDVILQGSGLEHRVEDGAIRVVRPSE